MQQDRARVRERLAEMEARIGALEAALAEAQAGTMANRFVLTLGIAALTEDDPRRRRAIREGLDLLVARYVDEPGDPPDAQRRLARDVGTILQGFAAGLR